MNVQTRTTGKWGVLLTQSHISPSIPVYEENVTRAWLLAAVELLQAEKQSRGESLAVLNASSLRPPSASSLRPSASSSTNQPELGPPAEAVDGGTNKTAANEELDDSASSITDSVADEVRCRAYLTQYIIRMV